MKLKKGLKVLFCGDRNWTDTKLIAKIMDLLAPSVVIHGNARGADKIADANAAFRGIKIAKFNAHWQRLGKAAGHIRNQRMLDVAKPDLVVAFHDKISESKGTANMLKLAKKAGVPALLYFHTEYGVKEYGLITRE